MTGPSSERTADADAASVREECAKLISARIDPLFASGSLPPMWPWWLPLVDDISDRLVARNQQLQEALAECRDALYEIALVAADGHLQETGYGGLPLDWKAPQFHDEVPAWCAARADLARQRTCGHDITVVNETTGAERCTECGTVLGSVRGART